MIEIIPRDQLVSDAGRFKARRHQPRLRDTDIAVQCGVKQQNGNFDFLRVACRRSLAHLRTLDERVDRNRRHVETLAGRLADVRAVRPIAWQAGAQPAFWTWLVRCGDRDTLLERLKGRGVQCSKLHQPNDVYSGFGSAARALPHTARFIDEILALPCGWWLADSTLELLADEVRAAAAGLRGPGG